MKTDPKTFSPPSAGNVVPRPAHMATAPTETRLVDTSLALDRSQIVKPIVQVYAVFVRRLNLSASILLHFGQQDQPGSTMRQGEWVKFPNATMDTGIYLSCPAGGPGALAELEIIYAGDGHGGPAVVFGP